MVKFTETQRKIAVLLLHASKTADDISKQLNLPLIEVNDALKGMLKLKVVRLEGYPPKYCLMENIVEAVKRRKELQEKDPFELRLKAIIEFKAVEENLIEKMVSEIEAKLRKEKNFTIYDIYRAKPIKEGTHYSAYLEVNFSVADFSTLIQFMYYYGPVSVEVIKPQKIVISMDDLQDALMDMAEMIQAYNASMLKYMEKEELEEFAKNLYKPSQG